MAKLSSLIVDLQANTASLRKGLDEATGHLRNFSKSVSSIGNAMKNLLGAAVLKEAVVGLASFAHQGAKVADDMGKLAQSTGVSVESLSGLAHAATLSNVSTEALGSSLARLNKNVGEAAMGGKEQVAVFSALGVAIKNSDGSLRSADAVMGDIAERFANMRDGAAKAALAQELFGQSGAALIPLLNMGKVGLAEAAAEARRFGLVITKESAKAAESFNDNLTRFQKVATGVSIQLAAELTPALSSMTAQLLASDKNAGALSTTVQALATGLKLVATLGVAIFAAFNAIGVAWAAAASTVANLAQNASKLGPIIKSALTGDVLGLVSGLSSGKDAIASMLDHAKSTGQDVVKSLTDPIDMFKAVWADTAKDLFKDMPKAAQESANEALAKIRKTLGRDKDKDDLTPLDRAVLHQLKAIKDDEKRIAGIRGATKQRTAFGGLDTRSALPRMESLVGPGSALAVGAAAVGAALAGVGRSLLGALGPLGSAVNSAIDRALEGDVLGAIGMFFADILVALEGFRPLVAAAEGILVVLAPLFDGILRALKPLVGALGLVLQMVMGALSPALEALAPVLEAFAPLLLLVANVVAVVLTPVAKLLGQVLGVFATALRFVFDSLKQIALWLLMAIRSVAEAWNGIIGAVSGILRSVAAFDVAGAKPFAFLNDWANTLDSVKIGTDGLANAIGTLENMTFESAKAAAENAANTFQAAKSNEKAAEAAQKVTEALSNIPRWFRVAQARFEAVAGRNQDLGRVSVFVGSRQVAAVIRDELTVEEWRRSGR